MKKWYICYDWEQISHIVNDPYDIVEVDSKGSVVRYKPLGANPLENDNSI
jgi:hypothetical protein